MAESEPKTLFGFPVVVTDDAPKGVILCGPLPTPLDLLIHGSWEAFIKAEAKRFGKIIVSEDD
jgi:hypothetical protein